MTAFSSLTAAQRAQAAFLFADEIFGTDPESFEYELQGETVIGRCRVACGDDGVDRRHARKPRTVAVNVVVSEIPNSMVTVEMERRSKIAIQHLARRIVERMITVPQEA